MSEYSQEVSQINRKVCASTLARSYIYIYIYISKYGSKYCTDCLCIGNEGY